MKERIRQCFDQGATTYADYATLQSQVASTLLSRVTLCAPERILEVGCGTSGLTAALVSRFPEAAFTVTDISPRMLELCRRQFKWHTNIEWQCVDGEVISSPFQYDLIISSMTMHWFDHLPHALHRLYEKLTPNGTLLFSCLGEGSFREWKILCEEVHSSPLIVFPSCQQLKRLLPSLSIESTVLKTEYNSLYDFLVTLKKLGVDASPLTYKAMSAGKLRSLLRRFSSIFSVSHEVIYGEIKKC